MEYLKSFINKVLSKAAIIYLILTLSISAFTKFNSLSGFFDIGGLLLLFIFSLIVSWGLKLFEIKSIKFPLALILHYAVTAVAGYISFTIIGRIGHELGMIIVITVTYIPIAILASIIKRFDKVNDDQPTQKKSNSKKDSSYKKQFR